MPTLIVDPLKCTKCGICISVCPCGIIGFGETALPEIDARKAGSCVGCGHCTLFCPSSADSLSSLNPAELICASELEMPSESAAQNFLKTRRSVRRYKQEPLSKEVLTRIFDTVKMAPTACNDQPVRWIVSRDAQKTKQIVNLIICWMREEIFKDPTSQLALLGAHMIAKAKEGTDGLLRGAPNAAIAVVPKSHRWPEDGTIALTYLELAAHSMGVGACWGGFLTMAVRNFAGLREFLEIAEDEHVCGAQMLGYPEIKPTRQFPPREDVNITWL